jgi:hypothetical protein
MLFLTDRSHDGYSSCGLTYSYQPHDHRLGIFVVRHIALTMGPRNERARCRIKNGHTSS